MQAVTYEHFGDASVLKLSEIAVPQPGRGEVQVRVNVASLNPVDFKLRSGILRLVGRPKRPAIKGKDFAGVVTALGADVEDYIVGQRVFGSVNPMNGQGACAQFVALDTELVTPTPSELSDEVAACLPVAAGTALQSLADIAHLNQGQSILITGASGAVGSAAVQIACLLGAQVTGVCGAANIDYVLGLGAERVIDYKKGNWLALDRRFDVIFDAAAVSSFAEARPRLNTLGIYINTMPRAALYGSALLARLSSRQRCVPFLLKIDSELLRRLARLAVDQTIVPHIQETVSLAQVACAQQQMEQGQVHGKICVRVVP
ncbi:MAG: NAD(P)-dependent alcohol dehydrogenase [Sulfuritalea sp.]|nr:NAD(P)-dependent alcohol dehydrogenase [Sulfuritalea sp.]